MNYSPDSGLEPISPRAAQHSVTSSVWKKQALAGRRIIHAWRVIVNSKIEEAPDQSLASSQGQGSEWLTELEWSISSGDNSGLGLWPTLCSGHTGWSTLVSVTEGRGATQ